jgi:tRNA U34 5-methylaminomethyl-2-thiouridine-forming methyltransferase MnmC
MVDWRTVVTDDGSLTLAHPVHGESCHSGAGARLESVQRFVRGCELLAARAGVHVDRPRRVLDIGTGLGWNMAAALEEREQMPAEERPALEFVTLENSRAVLDSAFALQRQESQGPALELVHRALAAALAAAPGERQEIAPRAHLVLWLGDARDRVAELSTAEPFEAFFLDPFSPRLEPDLWSLDFFTELARLAAPGARLSTYSAATRVRAGLAAAGWRVGPAPRVGGKAEGTLALMRGGPAGGSPVPFSPKVERRIARRVRELRGPEIYGTSRRRASPGSQGGG